MSELNISSDLKLPIEAVTQTFAILAKRGAGKTYTGRVMTTEMLKAGSQVIVIDPIGVWWGLRSSADGKGSGFAIVIAGGDHADIPLQPDAGEVLAETVVEAGMSIVIDLSLFRKGEQVKFMTDFAETLYRKNRTAVHLMLDEADAFAPQQPMPNERRMLGAFEDIVRRGRARGIGVTMITQRPAVLNKNILTQIEVLVALRMTAPLDQKAIDEWVKTHADEDQRQEFMASLPSLPIGTAWFWSPGWLNLFQRVKVRKLETLDSSSTPKVGEQAREAKSMAPVDLEALRERMAATIQQADDNDPKVLKKQIQDLKKQLVDQKPQVEVHQVEVLPADLMGRLGDIKSHVLELMRMVNRDIEYLGQFAPASDTVSQFNTAFEDFKGVSSLLQDSNVDSPTFTAGGAMVTGTDPAEPGGDRTVVHDGDGNEIKLTKAARIILNALAQYPEGRTRIQISILSGYSKKSSSFGNALGELRSKGLISPAGTEPITITESGSIIADAEPLPKGKALVEYWVGKLNKAEAAILRALIADYPAAVNYDRLQEMTDYSRHSSSFNNAIGKLRTLELATRSNPIKANDIFFEGE